MICDYYNIRGRLLFTRRYYPLALPTVYIGILGALFGRMLLGQWDRAKMIVKLMFFNDTDRPLGA
jgi:hypothetical protein